MIIRPPKPQRAVCAKMCERCPFRPDGSGYAQDHPDLPNIVAQVKLGLAFYCHETALLDPRTKLDQAGDPDGVQPHFLLCRGGHELRMKVWREGVIAAGHTPGELVLDQALPAPTPCRHRRCGNAEWHHADPDGGFTEACEQFELSPGECECRTPAVYGTRPDPACGACAGTGYVPAHEHIWTPISGATGRYGCTCGATGYRVMSGEQRGQIVAHKDPATSKRLHKGPADRRPAAGPATRLGDSNRRMGSRRH